MSCMAGPRLRTETTLRHKADQDSIPKTKCVCFSLIDIVRRGSVNRTSYSMHMHMQRAAKALQFSASGTLRAWQAVLGPPQGALSATNRAARDRYQSEGESVGMHMRAESCGTAVPARVPRAPV